METRVPKQVRIDSYLIRSFFAVFVSAVVIIAGANGHLAAAEKRAVQGSKVTGAVKINPSGTVAPTVGVSELTEGECNGLGGKVETDNTTCNAKGQSACKTVDHNGVVRVACIDGVKN